LAAKLLYFTIFRRNSSNSRDSGIRMHRFSSVNFYSIILVSWEPTGTCVRNPLYVLFNIMFLWHLLDEVPGSRLVLSSMFLVLRKISGES